MSERTPTAESSTHPKDFILVENTKEAQNLLIEGAKTFASTMIWTAEQKHVIKTHFYMYSEVEKSIRTWIPTDFDPVKFSSEISKLKSSECFFSLSLSRANVFFKADYLGYDKDGLRFKHPEKIFKVQRRQNLRFRIPEGHVLRVEFQDPVFSDKQMSKKVWDISAGGLAFLAEDHEQPLFHSGQVLGQMLLTVAGKQVRCSAEVRHVKALDSGVRVGVEFKSLQAADAQHLAAYVFEESRKYYMRFV